MRTIQYVRAGCLVSTLAACILMAGTARADESTERPGSLLIFPKVVQAGGRETIIQITNTGNGVDNLHCFYINGENGPSGHPLCQVTDFFIKAGGIQNAVPASAYFDSKLYLDTIKG